MVISIVESLKSSP